MYYELDGNIDFNHQFPLFDAFLILTYSLFGVVPKMVVVSQIILNALTALLVVKFVLKILKNIQNAPHWIAHACGFSILLNPYLSYHQLLSIHPITFDVFFACAALYFSYQFYERSSKKNGLILILVLGLTMLERFTLTITVLPFFLLMLQHNGYKFIVLKKLLLFSLLILCSFCLFMLPWMYRNYSLTQRFEMTSGIYRYLWVGSLKETDGTNHLVFGGTYYDLLPQHPVQWNSLSFEEQMNYYKSNYIATLKNNPTHIVKMWMAKIKNYFWFSKSFGLSYQSNYGNWIGFLFKVSRAVLLIGAFFGLILFWKKTYWLFSALIGLAFLQSFFYTESRHIMPLIFILYVLFFLFIHKIFIYFNTLKLNRL